MTINKSKISSIYDKQFSSTTLRQIPMSKAVYIPSNLPNNGSPRTIYHRDGLYKYLNSKHTNNPPSPATRKPIAYPWFKDLYTKEEIEASKHKRSNRYKLIDYMKSRKSLSSKQKLEYLNRLKNGESLNKLVNNINGLTVPKKNVYSKNVGNLKSVVEALDNFTTNYGMFRRFSLNANNANSNISYIFKKVRILMYKRLLKEIKNYPNFNYNFEPLYIKYEPILRDLEYTILAVQYIDSNKDSDFKNVKGIKDVRKKLYDVIEKNIFEPNGIKKIQLYVVHSFNKILFGSSVSEKKLYIRSNNILRYIRNEGKFDGVKLEDWLRDDYMVAINDIKTRIRNKNYNINFNFNTIESFDDKTKKMLKNIIEKYYPANKNVYINKINSMKTKNHENILDMLPKNNK